MNNQTLPKNLMNFLGDQPFPYLLAAAILLFLGFGNIMQTIRKETARKDETGPNATKERYRNASSGLIVSVAFVAIAFILFAIGLTKL